MGRLERRNTLLNYCGIRTDFLDYTVDRKSLQAGQVHAGYSDPDLRSGEDARKPSPITSSFSRGT